jgi:acetylornithine deacetylase/succinyl-diaminopimelate desuccinylase-like protein|tara:strand:- start:1293 stop:2801 length:1509 start_codon:yes stop_codon:yes gene_type:complete
MITKQLLFTSLFLVLFSAQAQSNYDFEIDRNLKKILLKHKEFVSIPNLPENKVHMFKNITWVSRELNKLNFKVNVLASETLPVLFAEKNIDKDLKTVLFYFHLDGQPVNPKMWNQEDPFIPVLKERNEEGVFEEIDWNNLDKKIVDDWRIFGRAAADDKAPIIMLLSALEILQNQKTKPTFNIKIVFDLEEEYGSYGFLSTIEKYKKIYASDYFIIMDGPAHSSNKPTLTFGCRGIATCTITTYGSKLPQHSGHFGNYVSNPVFTLSHLLSSMKSESGKVLIKDYYKGIAISDEVHEVLKNVPDNKEEMNRSLFIHTSENVGNNYQEALQYPSLNIRQIETSWKGDKPKTIIPEFAKVNIDVRLVMETDGEQQLEKIKKHIKKQGFLLLDSVPTDSERLSNAKIVTFIGDKGVNAFRTNIGLEFGSLLQKEFKKTFKESPIIIRTMGGTVPIIPAIKVLDIPAIIVPMVNMDNNQHNPNENIRIGNIRQGIKICLSIFNMKL